MYGYQALQLDYRYQALQVNYGYQALQVDYKSNDQHRYNLVFTQDVIELFASTPDPDYHGHLLLEQYQAQVRDTY